MGETINNINYLELVKTYRPIAVIAPSKRDERYSWGIEEFNKRSDEPIWEPALGGEYSCIPLGRGLLMKKEYAEKAAIEMCEAMRVALNQEVEL